MGPTGELTGTVYLAKPTAEVRPKVYDKRQQMLAQHDVDIGPCVRYELRTRSRVGMTLRDAHSPTSLFYHYMAPALLTAPSYVQPWAPQSEGFTLPPKTDFTAFELMVRKLDSSPDVQRLLALALECGPHGIELLCQRLHRMAADASESSGGRIARSGASEHAATEGASAPVSRLGIH